MRRKVYDLEQRRWREPHEAVVDHRIGIRPRLPRSRCQTVSLEFDHDGEVTVDMPGSWSYQRVVDALEDALERLRGHVRLR